ncbi:MAG: aminotransferase class I/II-fold pyridoxal phosphate-dependent enzyme [Gammaproteobacteria bacterium]
MQADSVHLPDCAADLVRFRQVRNTPTGIHRPFAGGVGLAFDSNDYLGLAAYPPIQEAWCRGGRYWGVGSGGSHLLSGHTRAHEKLEAALAAWTGRERALLFSSGYVANLTVLQVLCGRRHVVVQDRLNHASLWDAVRLSGARLRRYAHGNVEDARRILNAMGDAPGFLVSEGVFSMDGDWGPLPGLADAARAARAVFMVDDAHGIGIWGPLGQGSCSHYALGEDAVPILMATLGKALGTYGAFVAGSAQLIEQLIQEGRPYRYTTALPPALAEATLAALECVIREPERRERLFGLIDYFKACSTQLGLPLLPSPSPIQPLWLGSARVALDVSRALEARGIVVPAIRPPTVPHGQARLRISLSSSHTREDLDRLLQGLSDLCPRPNRS